MPRIVNIKGDIISNDYKWIYDYFGWDSTCPKDVITVLNEVNGEDDIIIEMNSPGGSVFAAHEIYTAIVAYQGNIEINVVSMAGSAASEILTACKSKISPVGAVMIHNCSSYASGDYRDMDSASNMLKTVNQSIRNAYKKKTGLSDDELKELMDNTTWMSAEEADSQNQDPDINNNIKNKQFAIYNSIGHISPDIIDKLRDALILAGVKNPNVKNNKPEEQLVNENSQTISQACNLNKENNRGGNNMTLEELLKEHPELNNEIEQLKVTSKADGATEERKRLEGIDNIANTIPTELVNKAKYIEVMNASDLALKFIQDSAAAGKNYLKNAIKDSNDSNVNDVTTTPSDPLSEEDEDEKLVNIAAEAANSKRKAVN